jgi:acyl-coenzyme A thioesterase 13
MSENTPSKPKAVTEGPFAGWQTWGNGSDPFETLTGPFYMRGLPAGGYECAFMPEALVSRCSLRASLLAGLLWEV